VQLTIDTTNLRHADSASVRTLVMAAVKVRAGNGGVTLLNPQPPVARMLDLPCAEEMFSIRRLADAPHPDAGANGG
jgi:anti-anti-sigma factor